MTEATTTTTTTTTEDAATTGQAATTAAETTAAVATEQATEQQREQTVPLSRLQAVIGQKAEAERAREALARELKLANDTLEEFRQLGKKTGDDTAPAQRTNANGKAVSPEELRRLVATEAEKQNFDQRCNTAVAEGRKQHTDFDKIVMGDLMSVSPVIDQQSGRPVLPIPMLEAALETENASEVLYALGQDVNEASRIMALKPVAQAVELTKFATKLAVAAAEAAEAAASEDGAGEKKVSKAPPPIKSPTKGGAVRPAWKVEDTENFSTEEWIRQREKQVAEQRAGARR